MAVDVNIPSQIVVQTAAQWAADTAIYSAKRLLITSDSTYTGTDQRKFKIPNGTDTWSNLDYFPVGSSSGSSLTYSIQTGLSLTAQVNTAYIIKSSGLFTLTLPTTASVGDIIRVMDRNGNLWKIAQNSSQQIFLGNAQTTIGVGGSLNSTAMGDCIELICITTNNEWQAFPPQGNITYI